MNLRTIADFVTSGGVPKDGLTVTLWQASRFASAPEKGDVPADLVVGAADYSVVSSGDSGGVGTWRVKDIPDVTYYGHALIEGVHCWAEYPKDIIDNLPLIYEQLVPASVWNIAHNLGRYPGVVVVDSAGSEVRGHPSYPDANHVVIEFSGAFAGRALFNN